MKVRWKQAVEGFVHSHCGRWRIVPLYCGCTRPQMYELLRDDKVVSGSCSTQREAKDEADRLAEEESCK